MRRNIPERIANELNRIHQERTEIIKSLLDEGYTPDEIVAKLDLAPHVVHHIVQTHMQLTHTEYVRKLFEMRKNKKEEL